MEEAIASSQLEGAATTRNVAKDLLKTGRKPSNHHEKMILNNYLTMQRILELKETELSADLILELHQLIAKGTLENERDEGRFRIDDQTMVFGVKDDILHIPPLAKELPARIDAYRMPSYFSYLHLRIDAVQHRKQSALLSLL